MDSDSISEIQIIAFFVAVLMTLYLYFVIDEPSMGMLLALSALWIIALWQVVVSVFMFVLFVGIGVGVISAIIAFPLHVICIILLLTCFLTV